MGWITHNAIVVTSWDNAAIKKAAAKARKLGLTVLGPSKTQINGYRTFLVVPDGSKNGWMDHQLAEQGRKKLLKYFNKQDCPDGSSPLEWVALAYGSDDGKARITDSTWGVS